MLILGPKVWKAHIRDATVLFYLFLCSSANQDKLTAAIKDFRDALVICPSHRNANKYLAATLVEHGIQ